jgi:hypothetical protein
MNPYMTAWTEYQRADRGVTWTEAMEAHLQLGAVVSTPGVFAMCRPVVASWPDHFQLDISMTGAATGDTWHVWCAAGNLGELMKLAWGYGVRWATYQRHGESGLRRMDITACLMRSKPLPLVKTQAPARGDKLAV